MKAGEITEAQFDAAFHALDDAADPAIFEIVRYACWDTDPVIFSDGEAWAFWDDEEAWYETDPCYPMHEAGLLTLAGFAQFGPLPRLPKDAFGGGKVLPRTNGRFCKIYRLPFNYRDHPEMTWDERQQLRKQQVKELRKKKR